VVGVQKATGAPLQKGRESDEHQKQCRLAEDRKRERATKRRSEEAPLLLFSFSPSLFLSFAADGHRRHADRLRVRGPHVENRREKTLAEDGDTITDGHHLR